jgi:hypothetical protein
MHDRLFAWLTPLVVIALLALALLVGPRVPLASAAPGVAPPEIAQSSPGLFPRP